MRVYLKHQREEKSLKKLIQHLPKNLKKVIKLALVYDLTKVYARDTTPYDIFILRKGDFKRLKREIFYRDYKNEIAALKKARCKFANLFKIRN